MLLDKIKRLVDASQTQNESNRRDFKSLCFLGGKETYNLAAYTIFLFFFIF